MAKEKKEDQAAYVVKNFCTSVEWDGKTVVAVFEKIAVPINCVMAGGPVRVTIPVGPQEGLGPKRIF